MAGNETRARFPDAATTMSEGFSASSMAPARRRNGALVSVRVIPVIPDASERSGLRMPQCSTWAVAPCTFTCSPHELLDEPFEWFAVPPCEHRARALPVVGQHDEAIWPRRIRSRLPYDPDDPVEARDRIARFHAIGSGVVRDLVVVGKVHIDRGGAAPHLLDDERGAEMTQDHVRRRSREGIGKGARTMRLGPCRGTGLHELLDDLADRQQRPSDVAVRTDE